MYDFNLTMTMLETIMGAGAGSEHAEDFRFPLRAIKAKLHSKLLQTRKLNYADAHKALVNDSLDVRSVLEVAKDEYRRMLDGSQWPAASHAKDSKAMNRNYGSVNAAVGSMDVNGLVHALIQTAGNPSKYGQQKSGNRQGGNKGKGNRQGNQRKPFNSGNKSALA